MNVRSLEPHSLAICFLCALEAKMPSVIILIILCTIIPGSQITVYTLKCYVFERSRKASPVPPSHFPDGKTVLQRRAQCHADTPGESGKQNHRPPLLHAAPRPGSSLPRVTPFGSGKLRWGHGERNGGHKGLQCPRGAGCTWPAPGTGPGCGSRFPPAVPRLGQPRSAGCSVCHPKHLLKSLWTSCDESYLYPVTVNGNRKHGN